MALSRTSCILRSQFPADMFHMLREDVMSCLLYWKIEDMRCNCGILELYARVPLQQKASHFSGLMGFEVKQIRDPCQAYSPKGLLRSYNNLPGFCPEVLSSGPALRTQLSVQCPWQLPHSVACASSQSWWALCATLIFALVATKLHAGKTFS